MKRTVSLFEFMPYGAPELIAAARPNLARALVVSSLFPVMAFLALLPFVPMFRTSELPRVIPPEPYRVIEDLPSIVDMPEFAGVIPSPPSQPAEFIPVDFTPEAPPAPPDVRGIPEALPGLTDGSGPTSVPDGPGRVVSEAEPARGVWIYTDELPRVVSEYKPEYPDFARDAGVEGLVIVHALIGKDGRVIRVELDGRKNVPMLNATALEAAMKWKFTPALSNGHPVVVWYAIPFKFVLHD